MNRRDFTCALGATLITAPAIASKDTLAQVSDYLNSLKYMQAKFVQSSQNGGRKSGNFYMHRPGRARFDYGARETSKVIIAASAVHVFDGRSNTGPKVYPTLRSPLQHLLKRNVDLTKSNTVVALRKRGSQITVTMRNKKRPESGTLHLQFSKAPMQLTGWTVVTQANEKIRVKLSSVQKNKKLPSSLFQL